VIAAPQLIATVTAPVLLSCYEDLRGAAVGTDVEAGHGVGLALFIKRGMASWMQTCASFAPAPRREPPSGQVERPSLHPDVRAEVAMVLAEMALSANIQIQGAEAC